MRNLFFALLLLVGAALVVSAVVGVAGAALSHTAVTHLTAAFDVAAKAGVIK